MNCCRGLTELLAHPVIVLMSYAQGKEVAPNLHSVACLDAFDEDMKTDGFHWANSCGDHARQYIMSDTEVCSTAHDQIILLLQKGAGRRQQ